MLLINQSSDQILNRFYIINMEFLSLRHIRPSWWNVPSDEERGEAAVFIG